MNGDPVILFLMAVIGLETYMLIKQDGVLNEKIKERNDAEAKLKVSEEQNNSLRVHISFLFKQIESLNT